MLRAATRSVAAVCAACWLAADSRAGESELEDQPIPESIDDVGSPLRSAFTLPEQKQPIFQRLSTVLDDFPPFVSDGQLLLKLRTYYLYKDRVDRDTSEAWAGGGSLYLKSGYWEDFFAVELEGFTSQPIVAPEDRETSLLLAPGQKGYSVLGLANARLRWQDVEILSWRQYVDVPYVNKRDNRMTPQTFEGVTIERAETDSDFPVAFVAGYLWRIKARNSDEFVPFPELLVPGEDVFEPIDADRGMALGGLLWEPNDDLSAGALVHYVPDLFYTLYSELTWDHHLFEGIDGKLDLQFTYQSSVGRELVNDESFDTWNAGVRLTAGRGPLVGKLGFVITGTERTILNPWGSSPSYVNLMQRTFNRAGEKALLLSLSYDLTHLGVTNVAAIVNFAAGWDGRLLDGPPQDKQEVDVTLDYRIRDGWLENFWLRLRGSWIHEEGSPQNGLDFRVILNYDLPVL